MAGRGAARKTHQAADPRNGTQIVPIDQARAELAIPAPPRKLLATVQVEWDEFWFSDAALLLQISDLAAVRRLFLLRDERERCYREVMRTKTTRVPLDKALEIGLVGDVKHEITDAGETKSYIEVRHDGRISVGSQGQLVLSPWAKDLRGIDAEIRQLEDRFGLSTRSRIGLGLVPTGNPAGGPTPPAEPTPEPAEDDDRKVLDIL